MTDRSHTEDKSQPHIRESHKRQVVNFTHGEKDKDKLSEETGEERLSHRQLIYILYRSKRKTKQTEASLSSLSQT